MRTGRHGQTQGDTAIEAHDLLVPEGTRLLHIGPPKTGTTAIQGALHRARQQLAEHGVVYAGTTQHPYLATLAALGDHDRVSSPRAGARHWNELLDEVERAGGQRVVVSSEFFAEAGEDAARSIVDRLGGASVHVVVTLRPLDKIMPSAWQQYVRNRQRRSYERWLKFILGVPAEQMDRHNFWRRHRHDELVARWVRVVGPERVTVIVAEDGQRDRLPRTFEAMLGLPAGTLVPARDTENRSLTHGETEFVRAINQDAHRLEWPYEVYRTVVARGVVPALQSRRPGEDEVRTSTPRWALEVVSQRSVQATANIRSLGVRTVGDLDTLIVAADAPTATNRGATLPYAAAAAAVVGAAESAAVGVPDLAQMRADSRPVDALSVGDLVGVLAHRGRRRYRRAMIGLRQRRS